MFADTSADAAQQQLEPYHELLREIFAKAVSKFNSIEPSLLLPLVRWNRSRATCIWAFAMEELELAFPPGSPVKLVTKFESIEIHFGPNLVARLKKMTVAGFTSNYQTRRVKAYHNADQGELFVLQWAKPLRVDIGYVLNEFGTGVERVMVARRKAPAVMDWFYVIQAPDSGEPIPFEQQPATPAPRITARGKAKKKNPKESTGTDA